MARTSAAALERQASIPLDRLCAEGGAAPPHAQFGSIRVRQPACRRQCIALCCRLTSPQASSSSHTMDAISCFLSQKHCGRRHTSMGQCLGIGKIGAGQPDLSSGRAARLCPPSSSWLRPWRMMAARIMLS